MSISWKFQLRSLGVVALALVATASLGHASSTENLERSVDEAAISSQDEAVSNLETLLKQYRGTEKEPLFLFKLAQIQQQSAAMKFRVAHGLAHRTQKPVDLSDYRKTMRQSIQTLDELIAKFPKFSEMALSFYMRGKAFEEVADRAQATRDYLHLTKAYPKAPEVIAAYMSLAEFAADANRHADAIKFLKEVEKYPADSHFPHALYSMAWAYFNSANIPAALSYVEKLNALYAGRETTPAEQTLREAAIEDSAAFFHQGEDMKLAGYDEKGALAFFRKLDREAVLGKVITRYGKLLRAHDHGQQLAAWKDLLLDQEPKRPETLEVLLSTYEYQMNRQFFSDLTSTAKEVAKNYGRMNEEQGAQAQKLLQTTATTLQSLMIQYKESSRLPVLASQIASIYQAFTEIVDEKDGRIRTIQANLAETLFVIKDYAQAAIHYRWIVDHGSWSEGPSSPKSVTGGITVADASLKAIGARYEALRAARLVPGELKAVAAPKSDSGKPDPRVSEWIEWIDQHVDEAGIAGVENFEFEANRVLYSQGHVNQALDRLKSFAFKYPQSKFAVPSATLALDTVIAGAHWDEIVALSEKFLGVDAWKGTPFASRVYAIAADSRFKRAESLASRKEHKEAVEEADALLAKYGRSERVTDALAVASNSSLAMNRRDLAIQYLSRLAQSKDAALASKSTLSIAKLEEERYNFASAARSYESYLAMSGKDSTELRKRTLALAWLGGSTAQLGHLMSKHGFCSGLSADCERYGVLMHLMPKSKLPSAQVAMRQAGHASPQLKGVWAAMALENPSKLTFDQRLAMIEELSANWSRIDALTRFTLIPRISSSVPQAFALNRDFIRRSGKVQASEQSVSRRIGLIRRIEDSATAVAKLPGSLIKAAAINQVAAAYEDLAQGLRSLPAPRGLSPRDKQAYDRMLAKLARPFEQKASVARGKSAQFVAQAKAADHDSLSWGSANPDTAARADILKSRWVSALSSGNWAQVAFFIQEGEQKHLISRAELESAKTVSMSVAGANASSQLARADSGEGRIQ